MSSSTTLAPLSAEQVAQYGSDGYLLLRGVLSQDEAADLRADGHAIIDRLALSHDVEATWSTTRHMHPDGASTKTRLHHCHDVQYHSAKFTRLLLDERLTGLAAQLMDTSNVQLHHNKLFIKPPSNGSPFPLHQDWPFFPHEHNSVTAVIVHLDDAPLEKGCVRLIPGSHLDGRQPHEGDRDWYLPTDRFPFESSTPVPARAGDVLFFSCLMVHGSGINGSDEPRTTWLLQLRDAGDQPTVDRHRSPGQGMMLLGNNASNGPPPSSL